MHHAGRIQHDGPVVGLVFQGADHAQAVQLKLLKLFTVALADLSRHLVGQTVIDHGLTGDLGDIQHVKQLEGAVKIQARRLI